MVEIIVIPIVILSGGLATRLYPITKTIPKSLIEINNVHFIDYQLSSLYINGIRDVVICVGKFGRMIEDHVGDGNDFGLSVKYSYEDEDDLLGTGGAIKNALHLLPEEFMITYGDSYLPINYHDVVLKFYKENKPMLITIFRNKNEGDKSNILYKNSIILSYDKYKPTPDMEYIDYGLLVVKKSIFSSYPDKFDLSWVMSDMIMKNNVSVYIAQKIFYEIGSREGIKRFENKQMNLNIKKHI